MTTDYLLQRRLVELGREVVQLDYSLWNLPMTTSSLEVLAEDATKKAHDQGYCA